MIFLIKKKTKKNQKPVCYQLEMHYKHEDSESSLNKIYHANTNNKKLGAAKLISDKVNFRAKDVIWITEVIF